jgi:hypothetical protein
MTDDTINNLFGTLIIGKKVKWALFGVFVALAVLSLAIGAISYVKKRNVKK